MPIGDVYKVTFKGRAEAQSIQTVLHCQLAMAPVVDTADAVAQEAFDEVWADMRQVLSIGYVLEDTVAQKVDPLPIGIEGRATLAGILNGNGIGPALPTTVAGIITKRSALAGRANRGRSYFGPFAEDDTAASFITAGQQIRMSTLGGRIVGTFGVAPAGYLQWGIFSRRLNGVPRRVFVACNSFVVRTILGTQRSRRIGRGI